MNHLRTLQARVEARAAAQVVPLLFDKQVAIHKNHSHKTCGCSYCEAKRRATRCIGTTPLSVLGRDGLSVDDWRKRETEKHRAILRGLEAEL